MGILAKRKRDKIATMRKEGYTQKEVAETLGIHVRTVRKYDPSYVRASGRPPNMEGRLTAIEEVLRVCLDWLGLLWIKVDNDPVACCLRCGCDCLRFDEDELAPTCRRCGHLWTVPLYVCLQCFSLNSIDENLDRGEFVCQKCGNVRRM